MVVDSRYVVFASGWSIADTPCQIEVEVSTHIKRLVVFFRLQCKFALFGRNRRNKATSDISITILYK